MSKLIETPVNADRAKRIIEKCGGELPDNYLDLTWYVIETNGLQELFASGYDEPDATNHTTESMTSM